MNAKKSISLLLLLSLLVAGASLADSNKKIYRWVDKDGVVHFGTSIPPEYAQQSSQQLNEQGQVVGAQAAAKTPEQLAAEAKAKQLADQQAKAAADQKAHDKMLLDTYASTADITRTRDSEISAIDTQINVLSGTINSLQANLAEYQGRAADLSKQNKPVSPNLQKQIDTTREQLVQNQQGLLQQQKHKKEVFDKFAADMARYQQLTAPGN